jgi:TatD DNase family protein
MYLIDTHTHFFDEAFNDDRREAVERAIAAGVRKMVLPCCSPKSLDGIRNLVESFPENMFPTAGLHPEDIDEFPQNQIDTIFSYSFSKPIVAIGEIGIDLHYMKDTLEIQQKIFDLQIQKSIEMNLPVIIHCREAYNEVFDILDRYNGKVRGIFHCFSGGEDIVEKILSYNTFYFGIGGVVTFKKSGLETAEMVKKFIPLEKIVLETDSPYIAPAPNRGKRNESSFILFVAHKIAELKQIDVEQVINQTTINAEQIFKI